MQGGRFRTSRHSGGHSWFNSLTNKHLDQSIALHSLLEKRQILEILFFNCVLDDVTLFPTIRKPFGVLAKGLISKDSRRDKTPVELFLEGVSTLPTSFIRLFDVVMSTGTASPGPVGR